MAEGARFELAQAVRPTAQQAAALPIRSTLPDPRLRATSTDPFAEAVALWIGLHGLAHQRLVSPRLPWPPGIEDRVILPLTHLVEQ